MEWRSRRVATGVGVVIGTVVAALAVTLHAASSMARGDTSRPDAETAGLVHVASRLGFGPRPGQLEAMRAVGMETWIERQLHPERLDDTALEARLDAFPTRGLSAAELSARYFGPATTLRRTRQRDPEALTPALERQLDAARRGVRQVVHDLTAEKVVRATYSERQLQEVLVDFWFNHFNVFAGKPLVQPYVGAYEREAIRPHVLGSFRELLGAVAHSPAMLVYLDNWQSASDAPTRAPARAARPRRGLNENYARELLELHTLGVDGGYTQDDIVQVARAFTGWTVRNPREGGGFVFDGRRHDTGAKTVLGVRLPAGGGQRDGERVLDLLARHPSTARFVATKLTRRLVGDTPPSALVDLATATFRDTGGDLRAVVRAIVTAPAFRAPEVQATTLKSPFEFVVSALRVTGAEVRDTRTIAQQLRTLGMPPYFAQPPTGYTETSEEWAGSGALLGRMNFAVALAEGRLTGVRTSLPWRSLHDLEDVRAAAVRDVLHDRASEATRATLARARTPEQVGALVLGAPEFQRR